MRGGNTYLRQKKISIKRFERTKKKGINGRKLRTDDLAPVPPAQGCGGKLVFACYYYCGGSFGSAYRAA